MRTWKAGKSPAVAFVLLLALTGVGHADQKRGAAPAQQPERAKTGQESNSTPPAQPASLSAPPSAPLLRFPLTVANTAGQLGWLARDARYKTPRGSPKLHLGVDFGAVYRQPVYAIADGEVVFRRNDVINFGGDALPGGALLIKHRSPDGTTFYALYAHLERPTRAHAVTAGQVIGSVGHFYLVSGGEFEDRPRLHVGIYMGGKPPSNPFLTFIDPAAPRSHWVDPMTLLAATNQ